MKTDESVGAIDRFIEQRPVGHSLLLLAVIVATGLTGIWLYQAVHTMIGLAVLFVAIMWLQYLKEVREDVR